MKIVHAGWFQLGSVHGTHQALWQLARAQMAAGHEVAILNVGWTIAPDDVARAAADGIRLVGWACPMWRGFWRDEAGWLARTLADLQPDVLHLQYVRIPRFAAIARVARRLGIPYVISLHGGLKPAEMHRHYARKTAYWHLVEGPVHRGAAGIHFVTQREQDEYYRTLGRPKPADAVVANVVEPPAPLPRWKGQVDADTPQFVSLGRYDIWHKGLDLAAAMVRALRQRGVAAQLHLHGAAVGRFEQAMDELKREFADLPIADHGVVSGPAKFAEMARYDFYLQYSRFELFGMAVMEAACAGVPLVLSENCDLAAPLAQAQAAIVIPMDPARAAEVLADHLARPRDIAAMAERGRAWRAQHCSAAAVAGQMTAFYQAARTGAASAARG